MTLERGMNRYWLLLLGVAFSIRVVTVFLFLGSMPLVVDAAAYAEQARVMLSDFPGNGSYYWPPGTSLVLLPFFGLLSQGDETAKIVTVLISTLTVLPVFGVTLRLTRDVPTARLAGWLTALYPPFVMMAGQPFAHPFGLLFMTTFAERLLAARDEPRVRTFAEAGLALGLGTLMRPSMMSVLPVALAVVAMSARGREPGRDPRSLVLRGAALVLTMGLCLVPIMAHNAQNGAGWTVSTNNEANFLLGNNPYTPNYKTGHLAQRPLHALGPEAHEFLAPLLSDFDGSLERRDAIMAAAIDYVRRHPGVTALRVLNRVRAFWGFDYLMARQIAGFYEGGYGLLGFLLVLEAGGYFLLTATALLGLCCFWSRMPGGTVLLLALIVAYQAPYCVAFAFGTYHFVVMGLVIPVAAHAIRLVVGRAPWTSTTQLKAAVALFIFAAIQVEYGYYAVFLSSF